MTRASFVLAATLRDLRRSGAVGVGAILLVGLAVLVAGGTLLGLEALERLTAAWWAELRVVTVLREAPSRPAGLVATVRALPGVAAVRYVSSEDALAELRRYLGAAAAGLERLPANPAPARLEVSPVEGLGAPGLEHLLDVLGRLPGVEEVQAASGWVEPAERVARGLRGGGLALGGGLGLAAAFAVAGATRVAREGRADETAILRLSGAPETCVWGPLLLQASVLGSAGAALGWSALVLASEVAAPWVGEWVRGTLGLAPLPSPNWLLSAGLLGGGLSAGVVGGLGAGRP